MAAAVGFVADLELVLRDVMRGNPNGPCIEIEISLRSELLLVDKRQWEVVIIWITVGLGTLIAVVDRGYNPLAGVILKPHIHVVAFFYLVSSDVGNEFKRLTGKHSEPFQLEALIRNHKFFVIRHEVVTHDLLVQHVFRILDKASNSGVKDAMLSLERRDGGF